MRILLIEDDKPTRSLIRRSLTARGHSVQEADRAATGDDLARSEEFDVLVIDIQLPDGDGLDICRRLRHDGVSVPILFLTARGRWATGWPGWTPGRTTTSRNPSRSPSWTPGCAPWVAGGSVSPARMETAGLEIDFTARVLRRDGSEIPMTAREWRVLEILASRSGRVVRRDDLLAMAWETPAPRPRRAWT